MAALVGRLEVALDVHVRGWFGGDHGVARYWLGLCGVVLRLVYVQDQNIVIAGFEVEGNRDLIKYVLNYNKVEGVSSS